MISHTKRNSNLIFSIFLYSILAVALVIFIYGTYYYFSRNTFQKLISSGKSINLVVIGQDKKNRGDLVFITRINFQANQVGFVFLHPLTRLSKKDETISKLIQKGDEDDFFEVIEDIISEPLHYTIKMNEKSVARIIDIVEGINFFILPGTRNFKGNKILPEKKFTTLSGNYFLRFAKYLESNDNRGRLKRIFRHQSIILSFFSQIKKYQKIIKSNPLLKILIDLIDVEPAFGLAEALSMRDYLINEKLRPAVSLFPLKPIKVKKDELLILQKKRAAIICSKFFKKIDTVDGLLKDKNFKTRVYNAVEKNSDGLARRVSYRLKTQGIFAYKARNYSHGYLDETVILDHSGYPGFAKILANKLGLKERIISEAIDPGKGVDLDAVIILGDDYQRVKK
jgi:hypothetical protein